jgi:hemolysin-activating ACP:hemolysin acyltransferase
VKQEEKSTLKVGTKLWLINWNTPFSDSVVRAQMNVLLTMNMSNYRHYLMTEVYWNMNIICERAML